MSALIIQFCGLVLAVCVSYLTLFLKGFILSKTHNATLANIAEVGGNIAYRSLISLTSTGNVSYIDAERAALQIAVDTIKSMYQTTMPEATIHGIVASGLGKSLIADQNIRIKMN